MPDFTTWLAALALLVAVVAFGLARQTARNLGILFARLDHEQEQSRKVVMEMAMTIGRIRRSEPGVLE